MVPQHIGTHRVKLDLQTATKKTAFQNQNFLEKMEIVGVAAHLDLTKDETGTACIGTTNAAAKTCAFLTLTGTDGKVRITAQPLTSLQPVAMQDICPLEFDPPMEINWTESGVIVGDAATIAAGEVVIFTFFYRKAGK